MSDEKEWLYQIEKDVKLPGGHWAKGREKTMMRLTMENCESGDSFLIPNSDRRKAYAISQSLGKRIRIRTDQDNTRQARCWVV